MNVTFRKEGAVATIAFARPEKKNALTVAMYEGVLAALQDCAQDRAIRCVILTGEGGAFTAGNDLADFASAPDMGDESAVLRFLRMLVDFDKPIVVAVPGIAVGVGVTLLQHVDVAVAAESAKFRMPFVPLGIVPEAGSSLLLPRLAGLQRASEWLLLGETFGPAEAKAGGLLAHVVPDAELHGKARAIADRFAAMPPEALRISRRLIRDPLRPELHRVIRAEAKLFRERLASPEFGEAVSAFFEKRAPDFTKLQGS